MARNVHFWASCQMKSMKNGQNVSENTQLLNKIAQNVHFWSPCTQTFYLRSIKMNRFSNTPVGCSVTREDVQFDFYILHGTKHFICLIDPSLLWLLTTISMDYYLSNMQVPFQIQRPPFHWLRS